MIILCKIGFHSWDGCVCKNCRMTRHDWGKDWNEHECKSCGAVDINKANKLMIVAALVDCEKFERYLAIGANVNAKDEYGRTALMTAAYKGNYSIIVMLLNNGAAVNDKDNNGRTALMDAAQNGNTGIVKILLEHGADANAKDKEGYTALLRATLARYFRVVGRRIRGVSDKDIEDTGLLWSNIGVVQELLEHSADVNVTGVRGMTALMAAAISGYTDVVNALINNGAAVTIKDESGFTALSYAVKEQHPDILQILKDTASNLTNKLPRSPDVTQIKERIDESPDINIAKKVSEALSKFLDERDDSARLAQVKVLEAMGSITLCPLLSEAFDEYGDPSTKNIDIYKIRVAVWCGCALHPREFNQFYCTKYRKGQSRMLDEMRAINMKDGMNGKTLVHRLLADDKASSR